MIVNFSRIFLGRSKKCSYLCTVLFVGHGSYISEITTSTIDEPIYKNRTNERVRTMRRRFYGSIGLVVSLADA